MMRGNVLRTRVTGGLAAAVFAVVLAACAESDEVPGAPNALTAPTDLVIDEGEPAADAESATECWTIRLTSDGLTDIAPCEQDARDSGPDVALTDESEPAADAGSENECWTTVLEADGTRSLARCHDA